MTIGDKQNSEKQKNMRKTDRFEQNNDDSHKLRMVITK